MTTRGKHGWEWSKIKGVAFQVHGRDCLQCGDVATEIDHIIELDQGGSNDLDNLQPLCKACHTKKTSAYNSRRMTKSRPKSNAGVFLGAGAPPTLSMPYFSPKSVILPPMAPMEN